MHQVLGLQGTRLVDMRVNAAITPLGTSTTCHVNVAASVTTDGKRALGFYLNASATNASDRLLCCHQWHSNGRVAGLLSAVFDNTFVEERKRPIPRKRETVELTITVTMEISYREEYGASQKSGQMVDRNPRAFCRVCGQPLNSEEEVLTWLCLEHINSSSSELSARSSVRTGVGEEEPPR